MCHHPPLGNGRERSAHQPADPIVAGPPTKSNRAVAPGWERIAVKQKLKSFWRILVGVEVVAALIYYLAHDARLLAFLIG